MRRYIKVQALCASGAITTRPSTIETVAANLEPELGDVDLGSRYGIQFPPRVKGETLSVDVRVNANTAPLITFQIVMRFDSTKVAATACDVGSDWAGYDFSCTINNPVTEALMVGADPLSTKRGNALTVATVTLEVVSGFKARPYISTDCSLFPFQLTLPAVLSLTPPTGSTPTYMVHQYTTATASPLRPIAAQG